MERLELGWTLSVVLLVFAGCSQSQSSMPSVPRPPAPPSTSASTASSPDSKTPSTSSAKADAAAEPKDGDERDAGETAGPKKPIAKPGEDAEAATGTLGQGAKTSDERSAELEGKLDESLREFDGLILKEQELLDERRAEPAGGGGGGGAGADDGGQGGGGAGEGGQGGASDREAGEARDEAGREGRTRTAGGTGGSPDAPSADRPPGTPGGVSDERPSGTEDKARTPADVGDGHDDDIVARQLREAAMNEKDPELREKLWEEYRKYKKGLKS